MPACQVTKQNRKHPSQSRVRESVSSGLVRAGRVHIGQRQRPDLRVLRIAQAYSLKPDPLPHSVVPAIPDGLFLAGQPRSCSIIRIPSYLRAISAHQPSQLTGLSQSGEQCTCEDRRESKGARSTLGERVSEDDLFGQAWPRRPRSPSPVPLDTWSGRNSGTSHCTGPPKGQCRASIVVAYRSLFPCILLSAQFVADKVKASTDPEKSTDAHNTASSRHHSAGRFSTTFILRSLTLAFL